MKIQIKIDTRKIRFRVIFLLVIVISFSSALRLHHQNINKKHKFYALENASIISLSESMKLMNDCKQQCLAMNNTFPFSFKYHRYILRQTTGITKYVTGHCFFTAGQQLTDTWHSWKDLRDFVMNTVQEISIGQLQAWEKFAVACQDEKLKLSESTLKVMNMTRVHSDFEYYDDGSFKNLQPFTDLGDLFASLDNIPL